jgi:zinc/manganese transport system permease protein
MTVTSSFSFHLNPITDLQAMWHYQFMQHAFEGGTLIAILAGVIGYFVVLRRSAFAAHAFGDIGFAGAAGIVLVSQPPIDGLLGATILAALAIAGLGRRASNRSTQIGVVTAFALGLGLLFINLYSGNITEAYSILFGEILAISTGALYVTVYGCILVFAVMAFLYRPLLFASLDEDVAEAKGLPMLFLGTAFMVVVAVAVSFSIQVTGVLLIFSLMVTPAATAEYLSRKPQRTILISVAIALAVTWSGIFISFYTPYPVSFYITAEAFGLYVLVRVISAALKFRVRIVDDNAQRFALHAPARFYRRWARTMARTFSRHFAFRVRAPSLPFERPPGDPAEDSILQQQPI